MTLNLTSNAFAIRPDRQSADRASSAPRAEQVRPTNSRLFENKASLSSQRSNFEEATEVTLSPAAQASIRGQERATRTLSNATAFVDLAQDGLSKIKDLLSRATKKVESMSTELNTARLQQLAEESAAMLEQIDTIVMETELNGELVFNAGVQNFQFDLNTSPPTGDSTYVFSISEFLVSRESLGLGDLSSSGIKADPNTSLTAISDAAANLSITTASIEKSKQTLNTVAREFGITSAHHIDGEKRIAENQAAELAEHIAASIEQSVVDPTSTQILDADRVEALLGYGEDEEKQTQQSTVKQTKLLVDGA